MQHTLQAVPSKQQVARVAVDDATWRAFRQVALDRSMPVSSYLGRLVESELRRRQATPVAGIDVENDPAAAALVALETVRLSIDELDHITGRLARSALAQGASWNDIASSLGRAETRVRDAYAEGS